MRNIFLGIWICFLSATMMFGILFPFHGIVLGGLGIVVGWSLIVEGIVSVNRADRTYVVSPNIKMVDSFRDSLQKEIDGIGKIELYPSPKFVIKFRDSFSSYINDEGITGCLKYAKSFDSTEEAQDYVDFVPIGKQRNWRKEDVVIVDFCKGKEIL